MNNVTQSSDSLGSIPLKTLLTCSDARASQTDIKTAINVEFLSFARADLCHGWIPGT